VRFGGSGQILPDKMVSEDLPGFLADLLRID
jgi:hypothetical protein